MTLSNIFGLCWIVFLLATLAYGIVEDTKEKMNGPFCVIMDSLRCRIDEGCHDVVIAGCTNIEVKTSNVLVDGYFGNTIFVDYMSHEHAVNIIQSHKR